MSRLRLLLALGVVVVVLTGAGAYAVVRHQQALPALACRDLLASAEVRQLSPAVVRDLDDPAFGVDVRALTVPPVRAVDDARHAMQTELRGYGPGPRDAFACSTGHGSELLLVRQEIVPVERCYGPGGCLAERRTCAELYGPSGPRLRDDLCPDLH